MSDFAKYWRELEALIRSKEFRSSFFGLETKRERISLKSSKSKKSVQWRKVSVALGHAYEL